MGAVYDFGIAPCGGSTRILICSPAASSASSLSRYLYHIWRYVAAAVKRKIELSC